MKVEEMSAQTRAKYCAEHDLFKLKNAMGHFSCPFCDSNVDL